MVFMTISGMTPESFNKVGHAHNDLLSFCLAIGEEEFIVDPGSGEYTGNTDIRHTLRSVNNHSTVAIDKYKQRLMPDDLTQAFNWNSTAKSSLAFEQRQNEIRLKGKCSYLISLGKTIIHERTIDIYKDRICIHDVVNDMREECSISLPVMPGCK